MRVAGMEHQGVRVAHDGDRTAAFRGHRLEACVVRRDDAPHPDLLRNRRGGEPPPEVAADRGREPGEAVRRQRLQVRAPGLPDGRGDRLGGQDAPDPGPVRVLAAEQRALVVKPVPNERVRQVDQPHASRAKVAVDRPQCSVEPGYRDRHVQLRSEAVGVDDRLGRDRHDDQVDAGGAQAAGCRGDGAGGARCGRRPAPERGDRRRSEVPAVIPADDLRSGCRRLGGKPLARQAEPLHELGVWRAAAGGGPRARGPQEALRAGRAGPWSNEPRRAAGGPARARPATRTPY